MEITKRSQWVHTEEYGLDFAWSDDPEGGYSFPCTKEGVILSDQMTPANFSDLEKCQKKVYDVFPLGVRTYVNDYKEPAEGRCSCGRTVVLHGNTNRCKCGEKYNMSGQLLRRNAPWI